MDLSSIADNIARIQERISKSAERCGRKSEEIHLLAVSKNVSVERILEARNAGIVSFGENYVQEAVSKQQNPVFETLPVDWRFIGHLQSNKVRDVAGSFSLIQSVDSLSLANALGKKSISLGIVSKILLEVKLDLSDSKFGFLPDEVEDTAYKIDEIPGIQLCGYMGMAPFSSNPEDARPHFRRLRQLFDRLPATDRVALSMGMTGDFETAIEEGTTEVRIGTAIFGRRL